MVSTLSTGIVSDRPTGIVLKGTPLIIGRLVVAFYGLLSLITCVALVPTLYNMLRNAPQLAPGLAQLGISPDAYALIFIVLQILYMGLFICVSLLIFLRRSNDPIAIFVAVFLFAFGAQPLGLSGFSTLISAYDTLPLPDFAKVTFLVGLITAWLS